MRYEKYKQTGTKWITSIPVSWDMQKIGLLFAQRKEKVSDKDFAPISVTKNGILPQLATAAKTDDGDNRKKVCVGDFVINSRSDRKGSCGISDLEGSVSLINIVLQPRDQLSGRYAHYLLRNHLFSEEYYRNGRGIVADLWTTRYSEMKTILLPVPPRAEQDQIVRYLDWQVSKINRLIAAKKQEIALFEESKINHIANAVLHGVRHHEHCIETTEFGSIPAHWQLIQNKRLFCERVEHSETGTETLLSVSKHYGVKPSAELTEDEQFATIKPALSLVGYKVVRKNDLVMNIMRARNGSYGISDYDGIVSPAYCIYYTTKECNVKYLHYFLRTPHEKSLFEAYSSGIAEHRRRLYPEDFLRLKSVLPPIEEQDEIVEHIEQAIVKYDAGIANLRQQIVCLQDMKTRLISDVVTGQLDVRGIEVPEYEMVQDIAEELEEETEEIMEEV